MGGAGWRGEGRPSATVRRAREPSRHRSRGREVRFRRSRLVAARAPAAAWSRRTSALGLAGLALYLAGVFLFWRLNDLVVPWDSKNHFYPMFRFLADALRHGTVPLWNPYHFAGYPAVADPQSLIFTPSMVLFALVAPDASMPVFDAVILAHLFVGGAGVLALARRWGWHPAAGCLTALVFTFGGAASGRLEHTGMIISYIYFPWALWGLQAALARRSLRWAVLTGLFVALMALGRDQVAFTLCLCLIGCVRAPGSGERPPVRLPPRPLARSRLRRAGHARLHDRADPADPAVRSRFQPAQHHLRRGARRFAQPDQPADPRRAQRVRLARPRLRLLGAGHRADRRQRLDGQDGPDDGLHVHRHGAGRAPRLARPRRRAAAGARAALPRWRCSPLRWSMRLGATRRSSA